MSKPRGNHTVPKTYLKYFTDFNFKIGVYDKYTNKNFITSTQNVSKKRDFYHDTLLENIIYWEIFYNRTVENLISPTFDKLDMLSKTTDNFNKVLDSDLRVKLSYIINAQLARSYKSWDTWLKIASDICNQNLPSHIISTQANLIKLGKTKAEANNIINKSYLLKTLNSNEFVLSNMETLLKMTWIVFRISDTSKTFCTSDNPVAFYHIDSKSSNLIDYGPLYNGCIIKFPINFKLCLILIPSDHLDTKEFIDYKDCIINASSDLLDLCNQAQNEQCYRQVYYRP